MRRPVVAVIQARMSSTRLPGKVLMPLAGRPALARVAAAAAAVAGVDRVVVATSDQESDQAIADWCANAGVACHRGPLDDVLARTLLAAEAEGAATVMRLTADCPLLDPAVCGQVLALYHASGCDLATNASPPTWPDGLDCEVIDMAALRRAGDEAVRAGDREHVTPYILDRRDIFTVRNLRCPIPGLAGRRWTLDEADDHAYLDALCAALADDAPPTVTAVLEAIPALGARPPRQERNAGYAGAVPDGEPHTRFARSQALRERAAATIPLAAQTFSKSAMQYPEGRSPLFLTHGQGGRVWDADGNEYVDLVCGLLAVGLGHCDTDVDAAVAAQLSRGIGFSLPTRLEAELAERLVDIIPCAEMVRFGKNGTDATSAAVRLARAATGRDHVVVCGYHGWQDWYIGSTARHFGVPDAVRALTHSVPYNDLPALEATFDAQDGEVAALIMEPLTFEAPRPGYLEGVRALCDRHGTVLVFDEIICGLRFALGGAQELLGVTPDLACFGKALGNGMAISAVVGRRELMGEMERIFFSATHGGEALSLAAAIAVIDKMTREPVIERLWASGKTMGDGARAAIARHGLGETVTVVGRAPWLLLDIADHAAARKEAIRTLFMREMIAAGVLTQGTQNVCFAHDDADMAVVERAYDQALATVASELATGELEARLGHPAIESVFKVR